MKPFPIHLYVALAVTGCVHQPLPPEGAAHRTAAVHLKEAGVETTAAETRAALYLASAAEAFDSLNSNLSGEEARLVYNQAVTDLTVLLRGVDQGRMWNRPLTLSAGGTSYRLRFAKGTRDGVWDPGYFTGFTPARDVSLKTIDNRNRIEGIGGALVGVRKMSPVEPFAPPLAGVAAPVTALVDFKGCDATLTLVDPSEKPKFSVGGGERVVDADFSAPLAYYPQRSELWNGLMGALHVSHYMGTTGLYMVRPYDPDRIPLIFVHGLISTPQMWRNVINELERDAELRGRYQCWVFSYPTGNPPAYSALRLRDELAELRRLHPEMKDFVLIGHSMGGLISRMQATTLDRKAWNAIGDDDASHFFGKVGKGSLVERASIFEANPHAARLVFICTPHRGSEMALGSLGEIGRRMISLPADLTSTVTGSLGDTVAILTGDPHRMPNSVTGLSPTNPFLKVLDSRPMTAPYHTILGDRGRNDSPLSSDGVVKHWSSHLPHAMSEKIVPGPHGSCELPETLDELRRILRLHLKVQPVR